MKFKFQSIKTKILVYFTTITIVLLILFNVILYHFLEENTKLTIQNNLYHKAVFINNELVSNVPIQKLLNNKVIESFEVAIIKEGKILYQKGDMNFQPLLKYIGEKQSFFVFQNEKQLDGLYIFRTHRPYKGAILFFEKNLDEKISTRLKEVKDILFFLEPTLLLLLIFMVSKVIDKILKSIKNITETANKVYVTDFASEIPQPKYKDEIKDLVDSFNEMIFRLKDGVQVLEQFNSDVSHELKTPLTVLKSEIEITLNKPRDQEYYEKSLRTMQCEINQIQDIVDNLLLLTKYTKENIKQTFQEVSLDSILLNSVDNFNFQLKQKDIKLHITEFEPITTQANPILISTIYSNLIDNAIKYSNKGTNITIKLFKGNDERSHFVIKDEGVGISRENLLKVQDRFFRVDESRNRKIKGFGLGLSIVKNGIKLHSGEIQITSVENIGTTIEVIL